MESLAELVERRTECRTPIVFYNEDLVSGIGLGERCDPQELMGCVAEAAGGVPIHYLELYHSDDRTAGFAIDSCIKAGEWLLLHAAEDMSGLDVLLRYIGRRLFTIMPNPTKRGRLEDFRLFMCIPRCTSQSAVFRKLAFRLPFEALALAMESIRMTEDQVNGSQGSPFTKQPPTDGIKKPTDGMEGASSRGENDQREEEDGNGLLRRLLSNQRKQEMHSSSGGGRKDPHSTTARSCLSGPESLRGANAALSTTSEAAWDSVRTPMDSPVGAIFFRSGVRSKTSIAERRAASAKLRRAQEVGNVRPSTAAPPPRPPPEVSAPTQLAIDTKAFESKASDTAQAFYLALLRRFHKDGIGSAEEAVLRAEEFIATL